MIQFGTFNNIHTKIIIIFIHLCLDILRLFIKQRIDVSKIDIFYKNPVRPYEIFPHLQSINMISIVIEKN